MHISRFQQYTNQRNYTPHWDLPRWGNAMAGEVGEACNIIKKIDRDGDPSGVLKEALADELGDIFAYLCMLATKADINLQSAAGRKFNTVSIRNGSPILIPFEEFEQKA